MLSKASKVILFTLCLLLVAVITFAETMPVPSGQQSFSYDPVA